MEITDNKELTNVTDLDIEREDNSSWDLIPSKLVISQFSNIALYGKDPITLNSFFKISSYGISNKTKDSIIDLFTTKSDPNENKAVEKKIEQRKQKQKRKDQEVIDFDNLTFEIRQAFPLL